MKNTTPINPDENGTQNERLLAYLLTHRSIDPLEALKELGIYRLGARVWDLKNRGHEILNVECKVQNRWGETCRVACYTLKQKEKQLAMNL